MSNEHRSAREISALDCKSDPQDFERLVRYYIRGFAKIYDMKLVPEQVVRAGLQRAVDCCTDPEAKYRLKFRFCTWASWLVRQAIIRHLDPENR